jgi:uncharacterized protein YecE (DUF72 family)
MIRVGTCSWTEKTLLKSREFYPKGVKTSEQRLRYYGDIFSTVEVDSAYYAIPEEKTTRLWAERTPERFIFHVKAYGGLTKHPIKPATLPKDIRDSLSGEKTGKHIYIDDSTMLDTLGERFREALYPLSQANKLGVIVFQFPPWFQYKTMNLDYILRCKELMEGYKLAIEFRDGSWFMPKRFSAVLDFLRKHELTYITVDEPQTDNAVPFEPNVTTNTAYFRLHGRNAENWIKKGIETALRFAYLYSEEELKEFVPSIRTLDESAEEMFIMFNNCYGTFGIQNARMLRELLQN